MELTQQLQQAMSSILITYQPDYWQGDTLLMGSVPEFDSMAVVSLLTLLEEQFGIEVEDDELNAEVFESFGTLKQFVSEKLI